ncbi:MAG: hypothetical protein ACSI46_00565 [Gloeotrichia echinulata DVL01]|jgi:hypothetical protein|nr:sporulation protein [Gloeotrichia echinulata DEX184]
MMYITLVNSIVELGKSVSGQVSWQGTSQQSVTVKLEWHTEGQGSKNKQTITTLELGKVSSGDVIPFKFDLPYEAPVSFDGKLFRVIWVVKAEVRGGIFGGKTYSVPLQVIPRRSRL